MRRRRRSLLAGGAAATYTQVLASMLTSATLKSRLTFPTSSSIIATNVLYTAAASTTLNEPFNNNDLPWTLGTNWVISGGKASITPPGGNSQLNTPILVAPAPATVYGATYRNTFEIADYVAGTVRALLGVSDAMPNYSSNGIKIDTAIWRSSGGNNKLYFTANSAANLSVLSTLLEKISDFDANLSGSYSRGQTGLLGSEALDAQSGAALATMYARTELNGLATMWLHLFVNADTLAAGDIIAFKSGEYQLEINSASGELKFTVTYSTTPAVAISDQTLVTGTAFMVDAWITTDKVPHLAISGTECTYATQTTGVGTRASGSNNHQWFKGSVAGDGVDGKVEDALIANVVPTTSKLLSLARAAHGGNPPEPG